ncbi:hypothetical protein GBA52_025972 [Prunus armeniaca]|nr:hypothetical protein GBA52_025972 [Prunus armeniaca]
MKVPTLTQVAYARGSLYLSEGRKIEGKRTSAINIGTPSLLINLYLQEVADMGLPNPLVQHITL